MRISGRAPSLGAIGIPGLALAALVLCGCDLLGSPGKDVEFNLTVHPVKNWAELKASVEDPNGANLIAVVGTFPTSTVPADTITVARKVTITGYPGAAGKITRHSSFTATAPFFKVQTGGDFILGHPRGSALVLDGANVAVTGGSQFVTIAGGGSCTLRNGVTLTRNRVSSAVDVDTGAFFMEGGTITDNTASTSGAGGVLVRNASVFTMTGGRIRENTGPAGGVRLQGTANFNMNGGEISGNTSTGSGGGVRAEAGTRFTMCGGTISGNEASGLSSEGGGVLVISGADFTMSNGTISGNRASQGGGVLANASTLTMQGGTISGNRATASSSSGGNGGGIHFSGSSGTSLTLAGGTIRNNEAIGDGSVGGGGGGVYFAGGGSFTLSGARITGNIARGGANGAQGGGLYLIASTPPAITRGIIEGNTLTSATGTPAGGGMHLALSSPGGSFNIINLDIKNNTAGSGGTSAQGGGLYLALVSGSTVVWDGGTISGNTASGTGSSSGGGIYVNLSGGVFQKAAGLTGTIYGNNVPPLSNNATSGAAVYIDGAHSRNGTAGPGDTLNSGTAGSGGGWD
jgi:hypothetical protein